MESRGTGRALWQLLWAFTAIAAGCPDEPAPPPKDTPQIVLAPIAHEIIGASIDLSVEVTGCSHGVSRVWITERSNLLAQKTGGRSPLSFSLGVPDIDFAALGLPAHVGLVAHVTCADGTQADSLVESVTFLPASEVLGGPWPMGKNFWVDQDASSFLTCDTTLSRLGKDKSVLGSPIRLPFACSGNSELIDAGVVRYLFEPRIGVVAFGSDMIKQMELSAPDSQGLCPIQLVAVPGSNIFFTYESNDIIQGIKAHQGGDTPFWNMAVNGQPAGRILLTANEVFYPNTRETIGPPDPSYAELGIERFGRGAGTFLGTRSFGKIRLETASITRMPTLTFDAAGATAYFAEITDPSHVWACDATVDRPCTDIAGGLKWTSPALAGGVTTVTRTTTALVAWGDRVAYFLNPLTGELMTPLAPPIVPQNSLTFIAVVSAADGSIYFLAGAPGTAGVKEVMIFDAPDRRVVDFVTYSIGFQVDIDAHGHAWLLRNDLIALRLASEYRTLIGNQ